ncbi:Rpn family recombination-promoting nuclease/putative transposase [Thiohalocapsa sp. ML1]|jgi:predicted transposase/invertase (TIGR01784 family)|uniref:Rpn family recombination-promoting nuclease/putative transposase n=1 Tax=Thiohalocapsa sp. ML1 TaxID=1431688 RepID=UPI000731FEF5|nr:Rpn family recombination-promoting nuclease/putative transposase [Thiohalocapsa sp. ML1]
MDEIATPHDTYFRESFGRREIAQDFLRVQLPPALLAEIDLAGLEIAKDTYVAADLRTSYSDLVYRVPHIGGGPLSIYLLFEHKRAPEHWTMLQLLRYIAAEGEQFRKQQPAARALPPVYPIVIYHGDRPWRAPTGFHALVEPLPASIAPCVPSFRCHLVDLSARTNAEIKGAVLTRLVQLALRWIISAEPVARLRELIALIEQIEDRETAVEVLESLLRYYVQGTARVAEAEVRQLLQQTATGEPIMQTFIDRYIEQGLEQGREQGLQQGEATVLLRQIERKFGPPDPAVRERVLAADPATLLAWADRILSAESLDAVLH